MKLITAPQFLKNILIDAISIAAIGLLIVAPTLYGILFLIKVVTDAIQLY